MEDTYWRGRRGGREDRGRGGRRGRSPAAPPYSNQAPRGVPASIQALEFAAAANYHGNGVATNGNLPSAGIPPSQAGGYASSWQQSQYYAQVPEYYPQQPMFYPHQQGYIPSQQMYYPQQQSYYPQHAGWYPQSAPLAQGQQPAQLETQFGTMNLGQQQYRQRQPQPSFAYTNTTAEEEGPQKELHDEPPQGGTEQQDSNAVHETYQPVSNYYAIDVECVATGLSHKARDVAQIALVDTEEKVVLNLYVRPARPVVSYLTPLTGLTKELLDEKGMSLDQAMAIVRRALTVESILISYNIDTDIEWLGLKVDTDFGGMIDLKGLYRIDPETGKFDRTLPVFGQDHIARTLLQWDTSGKSHDAAKDALKSMKLWHLHTELSKDTAKHKQAIATLKAEPKEASFAMKNPQWEGVCMGNRATCRCADRYTR